MDNPYTKLAVREGSHTDYRAVIRYPRTQLKQLVFRLRDVEEVPPGFSRGPVHDPQTFVSDYGFLFSGLATERMLVVGLSTSNCIIAIDRVGEGTMDSCLVHPREVFRTAIATPAASLLLAHNHPSGNPEPSQEDIKITRQLVEAGKIMGVPITDHIIFGAGRSFASFAERGLL
jgi:DNA repair protein RadC